MENQEQNIRSWDDLIFENRNKAYGAYALRQEYSNGLIKGVFTSLGVAIAILIAAGFTTGTKIIDGLPPLPDGIEFKKEPKILADIVPVKRSEPVRRSNPVLPPIATTNPDPVEPDPQQAEATTGSSEGTTDGTATTDTGPSAGTDTGTDVRTPVKSNEPFINVEIMPVYKTGYEGMIKVLKKNMRYPRSAQQMGKEGTVYVEFVVNDDGEIQNVKVLRGFDVDCDKEAIRIVSKLTDWIPGRQNKMIVNVKLVLPIKFKMDNL